MIMGVLLSTVLLLIVSNVFMTLAWYGHLGGQNETPWGFLRFVASLKDRPWFLAVLVSWAIAFVEYLFQVPANRIGSATMNKAQLKILQEVIALSVFALMAIFYWKETLSWNYVWAGMCVMAAVFFIFREPGAQPVVGNPPIAQQRIDGERSPE